MRHTYIIIHFRFRALVVFLKLHALGEQRHQRCCCRRWACLLLYAYHPRSTGTFSFSLSLTHSRKRNRSLERERACTGILSTWKVKCAAASARMMMMMICRNVFYSRRIPVSSSDLVFLLPPHSPHFYIIYIHASGTDLLRSVAINFHSSVLSLALSYRCSLSVSKRDVVSSPALQRMSRLHTRTRVFFFYSLPRPAYIQVESRFVSRVARSVTRRRRHHHRCRGRRERDPVCVCM